MIYDVIIVGTGAGGATVAHELCNENLNLLILDKGSKIPRGNAVNKIKITNLNLEIEEETDNTEYEFLSQSAELMEIVGVGGTTPVSLANACYACTSCYKNSATAQFKGHDFELFEELVDASKELKVGSLPSHMMGPATTRLMREGEKLGYFMEPMPKFIDFSKCDSCGLCILGCTKGAKWDATDFIRDVKSSENPPEIETDFTVTKILHNKGKVQGVEGIDKNGDLKVYQSKKVVLGAGALNTPQILIKSDISQDVGEGLFTDLFITVGGFLKDIELNKEIPMGVKSEFGPYFLSPHYAGQLVGMIKDKGFDVEESDVMGIMIKIADESNGKIHDDGTITKKLTEKDLKLFKKGYKKCVELLTAMGVDPDSISSTAIRGAHPGGTAAIGKVVNKNLETKIAGLYITDASVIPQAPGRPPILTITALAKRLSNNIKNEFNGL
ncbi:glucose-methanol-choline oxidoreductase [Methanobacterium lacus]|uniref:Glucose-methanol-choline oxidoreductase n=1 Tax=Methanobacterium lacus (strain AL-21) TaxID=877455 RepID=F0T6D7_METLA|nr:GMC family oxidoreductase N-terminal domain-containing protein [Methanobacterium lacus]ADZ09452.1 glucose-methanol-choline oxidoreductase [Methanobacterium lacus]